jgi:hypothetical protein
MTHRWANCKCPPIVLLVADGKQDAGGFPRLEDDDDLVRLGALEIRRDEVVAAPVGRVQNRDIPRGRTILDPVVELVGDVSEGVPTHALVIPVCVEEPNDALGLLEGLDHAVEQDPIEAAIPESNATLMVLVERVHGVLPRGEIPGG